MRPFSRWNGQTINPDRLLCIRNFFAESLGKTIGRHALNEKGSLSAFLVEDEKTGELKISVGCDGGADHELELEIYAGLTEDYLEGKKCQNGGNLGSPLGSED